MDQNIPHLFTCHSEELNEGPWLYLSCMHITLSFCGYQIAGFTTEWRVPGTLKDPSPLFPTTENPAADLALCVLFVSFSLRGFRSHGKGQRAQEEGGRAAGQRSFRAKGVVEGSEQKRRNEVASVTRENIATRRGCVDSEKFCVRNRSGDGCMVCGT